MAAILSTNSNTFNFQVNLRRVEYVVAEKLTPHEIKSLSDIDDHEGFRFQVPSIILYPAVSGKREYSEIVKIIKQGIAKALVFFYPFAGRIFEGSNRKLMVDCNNEGIVFIEADADLKLEQIGSAAGILSFNSYMEEFLCSHQLDTQRIIGSPLIFIQVTQFRCGGLSLGFRINHTITDGKGLMQFINCIIELIGGASVPSTPPVWQREVLSARSPPTITCTHNEFKFSSNDQKPLFISSDNQQNFDSIPIPVVFRPKDIQSLRLQMPITNDHNNATMYSRFELIAACLWKCRTMALEPHPDEDVRISVAVSMIQKNAISLPDGYYGNSIVLSTQISKAGILCGSPLSYALDLVQRVKAQVNEEYIRSLTDLMVIKGRPMYFSEWNFIVSDLTKLGVDKIDFCGLMGKPCYGGVPWATSHLSFFTNFKNDDGEDCVMIPMCLPTFAMDRFEFELKKITSSCASPHLPCTGSNLGLIRSLL